MSRLAAKDSYEKRPFKPQIYKSRGHNRSYNQRGYQNRSGRSYSRNRDSMEIIDLDKTIETTIFEGTLEDMEDKIIEENIEITGAMNIAEAEIGQEKGHSQGIMVTIGIVGSSNSKSRSGSQASTHKDRIRYYNCREYDHFARDCPKL